MSSSDIAKIRGDARRLMAGVFENFYNRRLVSVQIGERKRAMKMQMEDYAQEKQLMESFGAQEGNQGRLFSILVQDSLEAQGQSPIKAFYDDVEIEGISILHGFSQGDQNSLENYIKTTVPVSRKLGIGFVQGRRAAAISWAVEFGYGRATNIIEPMGRSIDQAFWLIGSRPYRHSSVKQALKSSMGGTSIMKLPDIFGKEINDEDMAEIMQLIEKMPVLIDITYSEIGLKGKLSDLPEVSDKSVMIYGLPGTVGCPWETAAIIGEAGTVEKTLRRFYSMWGLVPSILPSPVVDISPAINMLRERAKEFRNFVNGSLNVPDHGPFAIAGKPIGGLPAWAKAVDASYYGNFKDSYVVNLLK
ncbi:MAG: hypothetical protein JRN26_00360 [Nitrososphaerota archaeon]|nr:hypothetical protein [Nitrososphaerota archaeon]MDG6932794.1 hypothetical protein [Nitrososphaerota archaeon]MDG6935332.1 hypothetical protein [Nitrososphaerota archaeon]MDG6943915.1 hypothetical protein [Nitrososphaerota archaeon]